jgi:hypothetical protein
MQHPSKSFLSHPTVYTETLQREEIGKREDTIEKRTGKRKSKKEEQIGNTWNATGDVVKMSLEGKM